MNKKIKDPYLYTLKNPTKYIGNAHNIWVRSSWELKFYNWCDLNSSILNWSSEEIAIPYLSPKDNNVHRYFVDAMIKVKDKDNNIKVYLVEIKPFKQTLPPKRRNINEVLTYGINIAKWEAAKKLCDKKGWEFKIFTEKELGIK
jgi:hypothetical protein